MSPVSYTHLDVYKRQVWGLKSARILRLICRFGSFDLFHFILKSINTLKTYYHIFIILIPNILMQLPQLHTLIYLTSVSYTHLDVYKRQQDNSASWLYCILMKRIFT